ncbi:multiple sugar transport system permease protein [Roseivivax halotolerans]|uniref:Multiple sugar transport system permease protein n=1 Tax=Roseivivax halotolerans TaxID=93684 RepID=A0A1I5WN72_9RHOB|nr:MULTISPECIES: sugar ABC transporter permease [Roseivivax]QFT64343.1 Lactose transport system permease protein LacF [Roseivivax sp. THAF30]SFQ21037.1 multiple sugar transport system permease protein [Roseivivax halotolerans]
MTATSERAPGQVHPAPWLVPAVLVLAAFYAVPVFDVARLAFSDASLVDPATEVSTAAFRAVLSNPALPGVVATTLLFVVVNVVALQILGLAIALLIARGERRELPGMAAFRTLVLAAWVVPGIANGLIWQILFDEAPYGTLNSILGGLGLGPVAWLSDPQMALVSAVIANLWQGTAFSMIVLYAARRGIDPTLYEVAALDGAGPWRTFRAITLPLLRRAIAVNTVLVSVQTLNTFDSILALTGGGPGRATEVLALFTFNTVFYNLDLAAGCVLALLLFALGMAFTLLIGWLNRGASET